MTTNQEVAMSSPKLRVAAARLQDVLGELTAAGVFDDLRGVHPDTLNRAIDDVDAALNEEYDAQMRAEAVSEAAQF